MLLASSVLTFLSISAPILVSPVLAQGYYDVYGWTDPNCPPTSASNFIGDGAASNLEGDGDWSCSPFGGSSIMANLAPPCNLTTWSGTDCLGSSMEITGDNSCVNVNFGSYLVDCQ